MGSEMCIRDRRRGLFFLIFSLSSVICRGLSSLLTVLFPCDSCSSESLSLSLSLPPSLSRSLSLPLSLLTLSLFSHSPSSRSLVLPFFFPPSLSSTSLRSRAVVRHSETDVSTGISRIVPLLPHGPSLNFPPRYRSPWCWPPRLFRRKVRPYILFLDCRSFRTSQGALSSSAQPLHTFVLCIVDLDGLSMSMRIMHTHFCAVCISIRTVHCMHNTCICAFSNDL